MWKKANIEFRFNLMIVLLVFVCGLSIVNINTSISRDALESEIRSSTTPSMVREITAAVEMHIASPAKTLQALGNHPMFLEWIAGGENPDQLEKIIAFSRQFIKANSTSAVTLALKGSGNLYLITLDDVVQTQVDPVIDAWFAEFEAKNASVFVNIHGPEDPVYANMAFINTRINGENDAFLGNIATAYSVEDLFKHLTNLKIGDRGATFLVRGNGVILLHPEGNLNGENAAGLPGFKDHLDSALAGLPVTFDATGESGERLLFVGYPVPLLEAMAFTRVNLDEMLMPIDSARNYSILVCLIVLLLGLFLSSLLVRSITKTLRRVISFAGDIARGETVQELNIPDSKEMASLSHALNGMYRELRQSNVSVEALQGILNGMDALLYVTDLQTDKILFINDQMRKHFGIEGDVTGQVCWKVLQSGMESRCSFCPIYALQDAGKKVVRWEEHNTVTERHYSNTDCLIDWTNNERVHLQHSVDITERKAAEEDVKRQLEQQALLSTMSQSFISSTRMESLASGALCMMGQFNRASHAFLAKYCPQEHKLMVNHQWQDPNQNIPSLEGMVIPFEPGSPLYEASQTINPSVATSNAEMERLLGPAAVDDMKAFLSVPIRVSGSLWGLLCMDDFQTARSLSYNETHLMKLVGNMFAGAISRSVAEDKLMRMSLLVESAPQYISYVDVDGNFLYVNRGASTLLGYTEEEIMAGSFSLIFGENVFEEARKSVFPRIIAEGSAQIEIVAKCKDGSEKILALTAFITPHAEHGIGAIALDVTEHRKLESELLTAKDQAERSNNAKSEFLSRMSHEMRTPLNAIIGMTSIAKESAEVEKKEYCLKRIDNASTHLLGVINDILDMSKIEANKFELSPTEFVFSKMLTRICDVVNFKVSEKSQSLLSSVSSEVPFSVVADEQRLGQVIANLLSNAIKFTPDCGVVEINASLVSLDGAECVIAIEVKDSGIGISAEDQTKLFKAFEQADGSISRKFGGTGLGLAISKRIVGLMGGNISVFSELGNGASFTFTIKAGCGSVNLENFAPKDAPWRQTPMLAVARTPAILQQFQAVAQATGCLFDHAEDLDSALACLERLPDSASYGFIWVEHALPGMDGVAIAQNLRRHCGQTPYVVLVSGDQNVEMKDAAGNAVIDKILQTPFFSYMILEYLIENNNEVAGKSALQQQPDSPSHAGRHVLLAEDVELNREVLLAVLEDTGLVFDCAENGQEAIDKFKAEPDRYDIIFMDIHMPGVDGYEATRQIRKLPLDKAVSIPIIAMTANVFKEDVDRCLNAGMNDHLGKPLNKKEILSKLKKYL